MSNKRIIGMAAALLLCGAAAQARGDDFGLWTEINVAKSLPHDLELSFEGEYRMEDYLRKTDRIGGTLSLGYKATKFMKFKVGYALLCGYNSEERKDKYTNDVQDPFFYEGYNLTESYWSLRHRFKADVTFDKKFFKCLKVSLRERYQYTYRPEQEVPRLKYRGINNQTPSGDYEFIPSPGSPESDPDVKHEKRTHMLRSRLEFQYDRKKCNWKPFVSFEVYNNLGQQMKTDEYKVMCGTDYKISKQHKVSMSYLYNTDMEAHPYESRHVLIVGYSFDF